jgi:hypothetical protein
MQSTGGNGLRQVGVLTTAGQPTENAPAKKMTHVSEAKMYAVRYGDEKGVAHTVMLVKAGNQWYMPPNAEQWSQQLRPVAKWLEEQLTEAVKAEAAAVVPKTDTVDVIGSGG